MPLVPPDLHRYQQGNTGTDYVISHDSGVAGPHVLLVALVHGNELCGAIALDRLLRRDIRPSRGRLTYAFANIAAFSQFSDRYPEASRYVEEDFNRLWSPHILSGNGDSIELRRARALRPVIDSADLLLDLHSMQFPGAPLGLAGSLAKGRKLASGLGMPAVVVSDQGHRSGTRLRDYGSFADSESPKNALLIECGQHWEETSAEVALAACYRFLAFAGVIEPATIPTENQLRTTQQRFVEVTHTITVQTDNFRFVKRFIGMEEIADAGTVIASDGDTAVRTPYPNAILIMPAKRLIKGHTAVRIGQDRTGDETHVG